MSRENPLLDSALLREMKYPLAPCRLCPKRGICTLPSPYVCPERLYSLARAEGVIKERFEERSKSQFFEFTDYMLAENRRRRKPTS